MDPMEWTARCAVRLREQWPHALEDELRDAAAELWQDLKWRGLEPEAAAAAWLRLGVLAQ